MPDQAGEPQVPTSPERHNAEAYPPETKLWGRKITVTNPAPATWPGVTGEFSLDQFGKGG